MAYFKPKLVACIKIKNSFMCDGILYTTRFVDSTPGTNSSYDNKEAHSYHSKDQSKSHRNHLAKAMYLSKICASVLF